MSEVRIRGSGSAPKMSRIPPTLTLRYPYLCHASSAGGGVDFSAFRSLKTRLGTPSSSPALNSTARESGGRSIAPASATSERCCCCNILLFLLLLLLLSQLFSLATLLLLLLLLLLVLLLSSGNSDDRSCRMVERDRFKEATTSLPPSWEDLRRGFVVADTDNNEDDGKTGTSGGEDTIPSSSLTSLQFNPGGGIGHFPLSPGGGIGHFPLSPGGGIGHFPLSPGGGIGHFPLSPGGGIGPFPLSPGGEMRHFPLSPGGGGGTGHFLKSLKAKWFGLEGGLTRTPCC